MMVVTMKKNKPKDIVDLDNIDSKDIDSKDSDFSFEGEAEKAVDKMFKESDSDKDKPEIPHITEKIRLGMEIKTNLPSKGYLRVKAERIKVKYTDRWGEKQETDKILITSKDIYDVEHFEIGDGLFAMDFRNDCNFWFNRSPTVVPAMIKQTVHTHMDIKKCYEVEKRKVELPIWLIIALIGGAVIILLMLWSLMG